jgi:hypothetical protein
MPDSCILDLAEDTLTSCRLVRLPSVIASGYLQKAHLIVYHVYLAD